MLMLFMTVLPWQSRCHCLWLMTGNLHIEHQGPSLGPASALSRPPVPAHVWSHLLISLHTPSHFHKMSNSIQPLLYSKIVSTHEPLREELIGSYILNNIRILTITSMVTGEKRLLDISKC